MRTQHQTLLRIGELHAQSQVPIKTIRYYEERGLIQASGRTAGGFRLFATEVLPRLALIKRAQRLGFSLHEIGQILAIYDQGELPCPEVKLKIEAKIAEIDQRIDQLQTLKTDLTTLMAAAEDSPHRQAGVICPILQSA